MPALTALRAIKLAHTLIWAFFAGCILALPFFAWRRRFRVALVLAGLVAIECLVVVASGWRCPLTPLAARYTAERADNFDIYLPLWLARYNKTIFGSLYALDLLVLARAWSRARRPAA